MATDGNVIPPPIPTAKRRPFLMWLDVIIQRKKLIIGSAVLFASLTSAIALLLPNSYKATVVILPPQQSGSVATALMTQLSAAGALGAAAGISMKNPNDQQIALMKSRVVEDALVERFHLLSLYHKKYVSAARKKLEAVTKTDSGLKDGLIRLTVSDSDPNRAAQIANGWIEEYKRFSATIAVTEASQRRLFYEKELGNVHDALNHAEDDLKATEQRTGIIDIAGQARSMIESAAVLRAQLAAKQVEITAMKEYASDGNPDLQRALQEESGLRTQLAAMDANSSRTSGDLAAPKGNVTQAGLDYARALREVKYRETLYDLLLRQYEIARIDEAHEGALIQVVEPAIAPDRPDRLVKIAIFVAGVVLALPFAFLVAAAFELTSIFKRLRQQSGSWLGAVAEVLATW